MPQSSEADLKVVIAPYQFASEKAQEQFVKLNADLAEVSPALLSEAVKARLQDSPHFLAPQLPQPLPGSSAAIEADYFARTGRGPGSVGLGGRTANPHVSDASQGFQSHGAGIRQAAPVLSVEQLSDLYLQRQGQVLSASPGLGGQRMKPTK